MFKTNSRKGLAIGAALSLVFSAFAATPAQAAGEVVLEPSAGTSYSTFVTEKFDLIASLAPGQVASNISQLKYKIDKASGFAVSYSANATTSAVTAVGSATSVASASTSFVLTPTNASSTVANKLSISIVGATSVSDSVDVTVTAFLDSNSNGTLDSGEFNQPRTVSFKKYADVVSVITITQPAEGDTSVKATATYTGINASQLTASDTKVQFSVSGSALATSVSADADGVFTSTDSLSLAKDATVSATVEFKANKIGATSATSTVTNKTVLRVTVSPVAGNNIKASGSDAVTVRLNSAFAVKAIVSSSASGAVAVAGAAISAQVSTSATLTATKSLTVNGVTYTKNASLSAITLTSDANGEAVVNVTPAGFSTSETVTFIVKSQNNTTNNVVASFQEAVYTVTAAENANLKTTPGASFTVNYSVKDQWSVLTTNAYRVAATYDGTTKYVNLSGGKAAVTFTATSSNAVSANVTNGALEEQNATTLNWASVAGTTTASAIAVLATNTADAFDVNPAATASGSIARVSTTADATGIKLTNRITLSGSVNNAGAPVVVSATGVQFAISGDTATTKDSITLNTDASGHFTVSAYVTKAGDTTVAYKVGSATKSTVITIAAAGYNEGKTLSITTTAVGGYVPAGSTIRASVKLVDEYGNAVEVDDAGTASFGVTVTGPGFQSTLPSKTGSSGSTADFSILLGSTDTGSLVFTATYDADGATTTIAAISKTETVTIGKAPATAKLTVGSFKGFLAIYASGYEGKKLSYKVAGKWGSVASLKAFERVVRKTGAGYTVKVDLYVDGSLVKSETVTTK